MSVPFGLLLVGLNASGATERDFNEWCDTKLIEKRKQQAGCISAQRWIGVEKPEHCVVLFDFSTTESAKECGCSSISADLSAFPTGTEKRAELICCFESEQTLPGNQKSPNDAGALLVAAMNIKSAYEEEFNAWYDEEHIPYLAAVPGTICARRFKTMTGVQRSLAIYHLESPAVFTSPAFKTAVETPWTHRLRPHTSDRLFMLLQPSTNKI